MKWRPLTYKTPPPGTPPPAGPSGPAAPPPPPPPPPAAEPLLDFNVWPTEPVQVSTTESIIEVFWNPAYELAKRWRTIWGTGTLEVRLAPLWDATDLTWVQTEAGGPAGLERDYQLNMVSYRRLLVRLHAAPDIRVSIVARIDGKERVLADQVPGELQAQELGGPVVGRRLEHLQLQFFSDTPGPKLVKLRWVMLEQPGLPWRPPAIDFDRYVVDHPPAGFVPGRGLVFGPEELEDLRAKLAHPSVARAFAEDQKRADQQAAQDPGALLRRYSLYAPGRYGRVADLTYDLGCDGLLLALVGLMTENDVFLNRAARHAVVLAHQEQWAEGFMDRFPGLKWYHSAFAPNTATIRAALLLDWCWNWLTPAGRDLVRSAIRLKGLPPLELGRDAPANQGVRFSKGLVLGQLASADTFGDRDLITAMREQVGLTNQRFEGVIRSDGTFTEGPGYGIGTLASAMLTYHVLARFLRLSVRDVVHPRFVPALRHVLDLYGRLPPTLAAFAAGPLEEGWAAGQCVATGIGAAAGYSETEMAVFGLDWLWAPRPQDRPQPPVLPPFVSYPDGGWVFLRQGDPNFPALSFESGIWTGLGHSWKHVHALTLQAWGEPLLITRGHVAYEDARFGTTARTAASCTFAPGGRDQDATGQPGCGGQIRAVTDLGLAGLIESDNTAAWRAGVERAVRRVLFLRPQVVIVEDVARFTAAETGIQSWNGLAPWELENRTTCLATRGAVGLRLRALLPEAVTLTVGEDAVHRDPFTRELVPAFRAEIASPAGLHHRLLTMIEVVPPGYEGYLVKLKVLDRQRPVLEIRQEEVGARHEQLVIRLVGDRHTEEALWGMATDGALAFAIQVNGRIVEAGAFDATFIRVAGRELRGQGLVTFAAPARA